VDQTVVAETPTGSRSWLRIVLWVLGIAVGWFLLLVWVFAIRAKIRQAQEDEDENIVPPSA
jgi:4-amino-4-deoxy-L-arabinose transferase-like glycosyltransferase